MSAKVEGTTKYMEDYPAKRVEVSSAQKPETQPVTTRVKAKFDGRTMHKEHYKSWVARESDKLQFRELQPVVGELG